MTLSKIKQNAIGNASSYDSDEIVARAKHVNPIIDRVNGISSDVGAGKFDTIAEYTAATGVTIDGVLLKDSAVSLTAAVATGITISGKTSAGISITTTAGCSGFTITGTAQSANDLNSITTTTAVTSAALMKALDVAMTTTGASSTNMIEVARFTLTSAVRNGNWANALVGKIDFSTTGFVTGLAGAICAEVDLPTTNPTGGAGTYTCFEGELVYPASGYSSTVPVSFLCLNASGTTRTLFDSNGFIMDISGLTSGATNAFYDHDGTAGGDTVGGWLKIRVNGTAYYIGLYDATH